MRVKFAVDVIVLAIIGIATFSVTGRAFNPQPDPPGFGLVTLVAGTIGNISAVSWLA